MFFFFFSSRRRHTRCSRDWSSDVCSSDLQEILARKPASLTHAQCASIGLAGLTALVSIEDTLKLKAGETILIHGGAGGVGGFAIAPARPLGARAVPTASSANHNPGSARGAHTASD